MDKVFYVYIHFRKSDDRPFYVGKGHGSRHLSKNSRNKYWKAIVEKHGFYSKLIMKNMSENCSFTLERIVIHDLRSKGFKLANSTEGGSGVRGPKIGKRRPVECSNGMSFDSIKHASEYLGINASKISSVCNGKRHSAYGFTFWGKGCEEKEFVSPMERLSKTKSKSINCSNGMKFDSLLDASRWIFKTKGVKMASGNISYACSGKIGSAYGFSWWYEGSDEIKYIPTEERKKMNNLIPVVRSDGVRFDSFKSAADHMKEHGHLKADGWPISNCARGRQKQAYGYEWSLC